MKILSFSFGQKRLVVWQKKRGRPQKSFLCKIEAFWRYLEKVYHDDRFAGNRISRVLRRIFELKKIKEAIGLNLLFLALSSGAATQWLALRPMEGAEGNFVHAVEKVQVTTEEGVHSPLAAFQITQGFHAFHPGIDLAAPSGTKIQPVADGQVEMVGYGQLGYGNYVIIRHSAEFQSLYAHLQKVEVKSGQEVNKETIIGTVGSTGWSTGPHLHLEVWQNYQPINPLMLIR